jgi:hypothetical protein
MVDDIAVSMWPQVDGRGLQRGERRFYVVSADDRSSQR